MKQRMINCLIVLGLIITMVPMGTNPIMAKDYTLYGDADNNNQINIQDVNLMERYLNGEQEAIKKIDLEKADIDVDGKVNQKDVQLLKDYLVGNVESLTPDVFTITFDTAGGSAIKPMKVGKGYTLIKEIPRPAKEGYLFVEWKKEDGKTFYQEDAIVSNMTLTAVYQNAGINEQVHIDTFTLDDQESSLSFKIKSTLPNAKEVLSRIRVFPKDGSDPVEIVVTEIGNNLYDVKAKDGFLPGASYELILSDEMTFEGKEKEIRKATFIIKKTEVDNLQYNSDVVFIKDDQEMKYTINNQTVDVLDSYLLSNDSGTQKVTGTFPMSQAKLEINDIVCIYEDVDPRKRDYTKDDYNDDAIAYVKITNVEDKLYTFASLNEDEAQEVLLMPDTIPYKVNKLPTKETGTVLKNSYDSGARSALGYDKAPEFNDGDILVFYTVDFEDAKKDTPSVYAQITKTTEDEVSYKVVTRAYIEKLMQMYVSSELEMNKVLTAEQEKQILDDVKKQAQNGGFVDEATNYMFQSAMSSETTQKELLANGFSQEEINAIANAPTPAAAAAAAGGSQRYEFVVEQTTISPRITYDQHFENGIGVGLQFRAILSIEKQISPTRKDSIKIDLSAEFFQEIKVDFDVDVDLDVEWIVIYPDFKELTCKASFSILNYTTVSVGAKIYTVSDDLQKFWNELYKTFSDLALQKEIRPLNRLKVLAEYAANGNPVTSDYMGEIDKIKNSLPRISVDGKDYTLDALEEKLGMKDVGSEFKEVLGADQPSDSIIGLDQLMNKYSTMLSNESDWIEVLNQSILNVKVRVKIVEMKISANLFIRANVNVAIGADLEYKTGKRYTFWLKLSAQQSGSNEMDLIDERLGFQFYVMGSIGIKAGVKVEFAIGLLSTSIASVGANVEFGPYLKLNGYFFYINTRYREANQDDWKVDEKMLGAMNVDFGLFVTVKFKAQAFENTIKYEPTLYSGEFPLVTAGNRKNPYDFANHMKKSDVLYIIDSDGNSTNGITMNVPEAQRTMKVMDLVTGLRTQEAFNIKNFNVRFTNSNFSLDKQGRIAVDVPKGTRFMKGDMIITWNVGKLAFSKYDIATTVPVVWTNLTTSEMNNQSLAKVMVGNMQDGYETVWSDQFTRLQTFDLPSENDILNMINYDSYNLNGVNLKYSAIKGYAVEETEGLQIISDTTYYFDVTPAQYSVTVEGVVNEDGTKEPRTFSANYGDHFDLSSLTRTGANNTVTNQYSSFQNITHQNGNEEFALDTKVDMSFLTKYGNSPILKANYLNEERIATFTFSGISAPEVKVPFKKGDRPYFANLNAYVEQHGGPGSIVVAISPTIQPSESSVTYNVTCAIDKANTPKHKLLFESNGGTKIEAQEYRENSIIFQPPAKPKKTGYDFIGWYKDEKLTSLFDFAKERMPETDITLYAKWEARKYTVSLNSDSKVIHSFEIAYDQAFGSLLSPPAKAEMKFVGWFTQKDGGTKIEVNDVYKTDGDVTLYARWENKEKINLTADDIKYTPIKVDYKEGVSHSFAFTLPEPYKGMESSFKVAYNKQTTDSWISGPLPNAGTYNVKLSRDADENYLAVSEIFLEAPIIVNKIPMVVRPSGAGNQYLSEAKITIEDPKVTVSFDPKALYPYKGDGAISYELQKTIDGVNKVVDKNTTGVFYIYDKDIYVAIIRIAEGTNYLANQTRAQGFDIDNGTVGTVFNNDPLLNYKGILGERRQMSGLSKNKATTLQQEEISLSQLSKRNIIIAAANISAKKTQTVNIPITLESGQSIWGILANVDYDERAFDLLSVSIGDMFGKNMFTLQKDLKKSDFTFLATNDKMSNITGGNGLITFTFKVKNDAKAQRYPIVIDELQVVDAKGNLQAITIKDGSISIASDAKATIKNETTPSQKTIVIDDTKKAEPKVDKKKTEDKKKTTLKNEKVSQNKEPLSENKDQDNTLMYVIMATLVAAAIAGLLISKRKKVK